MSVHGLTTMRELLESAIGEIARWQASPTVAGIPAHRIANVGDKLQALRGCRSVGLLRTGLEHVSEAIVALGVPVSELAPSLLPLSAMLDERHHR